MNHIFFVCHGNTCRSPMAAEIFRHISKTKHVNGISVDSFGINPNFADNPDVKVLREAAVTEVMGGLIELCRHKPKGIDEAAPQSNDTLVMLNPDEMSILEEQIEGAEITPRLLAWDIEDPYLKPLDDYIETARSLKAAIERNIDLLARY